MVDDSDHEHLSQFTWGYHNAGYGTRQAYVKNGKYRTVYMHREITNAPAGKEVDHIDGNPLNNQRANLRVCEHWQNQCNQRKLKANNTSGVTGVFLDKKRGAWYAQITRNNKVRTVGSGFKTIEEAAECRRVHALRHYGEFAAV